MKTVSKQYHTPVMLSECLTGLNIQPDGVYIDATFGGGGHARAIFQQLNEHGKLIAFDQDADAQKNIWQDDRLIFIASNFEFLQNHLRALNIHKVDGIIADLGVSSHQFDVLQRGFSIRGDAPLDMRMNQKNERTAENVINESQEEDLVHIFRNYGELKNARQIARAIIEKRTHLPILSTQQLIEALERCKPKQKDFQFFAQVFQALRIEVNAELDALKRFLEQAAQVIKPDGRLVVMSYHSLEDRCVKNFLKRGNINGEITKDFYGNLIKPFNEIIRHPIVPSEEELHDNPRARSAKLRIGVRKL